MARILRISAGIAMLASVAAAPSGRQSLGVFSGWAPFRDVSPARCYAIAEPLGGQRGGRWRAFAAVTIWPRQRINGQVHFRLREPRTRGTPIKLTLGERQFPLVGASVDAWAANPKMDAAIIAAMRGGTAMVLVWTSDDGRKRRDAYALQGVATAIDAAALGCARVV